MVVSLCATTSAFFDGVRGSHASTCICCIFAQVRRARQPARQSAKQLTAMCPSAQMARNQQPTRQLKRAANKFVALLTVVATRSHTYIRYVQTVAVRGCSGGGSSPCSRRRAHWRECLINFKWHLNAFAAFHFSAVSHAFSWLLLLLLLLLLCLRW